MEAVKLGSVTLALKSDKMAVIAAMKRNPSRLVKSQHKMMEIDENVGAAMSGLLSDAQQLAKFMREECLDSKWSYDAPIAIERLARSVAMKSQPYTQTYGRRPYGVGFLIAGQDVRQTLQFHMLQVCYNSMTLFTGTRCSHFSNVSLS